MSSRERDHVANPEWRIDWSSVKRARPLTDAEPATVPPPGGETAAADSQPAAPRRIVLPRPTTFDAPARSSPPSADAFLTHAGRRRLRGPRISPLAGALAALLLAAAAVVTYLLLAGRDESTPRQDTVRAQRARMTFAPRRPFEAGGVRFVVAPRPNQPWVLEANASPTGRGQRWATVAVIYRNLSRRRLTAESLRFRIQDEKGRVYLPDPIVGNHGTELPANARIPVARLVHGQLAYRVRSSARSLALLIDASSRQRIRVPLGSA